MNESGIFHARLPTPDSRLPTFKAEARRQMALWERRDNSHLPLLLRIHAVSYSLFREINVRLLQTFYCKLSFYTF
jgi:hypothetical protein